MAELENRFARVAQQLDPECRLVRAWRLEGGVSAEVTALEIVHADGQMQKLLVRQHGRVDLEHNPQIAADEFRLLRLLRTEGLTTPQPCYFDQSGEILGTPYVVIEFIEGQTEFAPADLSAFLAQCAAHLVRIHCLDCARLDLSFLPQQTERAGEKLRERLMQVDEASDERRIGETLAAVWPLSQDNPSVLLHGDFWPGNLLWREGQLVGVIDWEDAARGDPLADLANSRLEILWAFGGEAMQQFTRRYQALTELDYHNLPYWDLCAALRSSQFAAWAADERAAATMRARYHWFAHQAYERLATQDSL